MSDISQKQDQTSLAKVSMKSGRVYSEKTASKTHSTAPKTTAFMAKGCGLRFMALNGLSGRLARDHGFFDRQIHQRGQQA